MALKAPSKNILLTLPGAGEVLVAHAQRKLLALHVRPEGPQE